MDYKIPDNIKLLSAKDHLSDSKEQELVKRELVNFLTAYLTLGDEDDKTIGRNSLANITDIVSKDGEFPVKGTVYPFERDVAGRMVRTRNYTMKEGINKDGKEEVYVIAADRDWWDKNKIRFTILTLALGTLIGSLGNPLSNLINTLINKEKDKKEDYQIKVQANKSILNQSDSLYILQIHKKDSVNK